MPSLTRLLQELYPLSTPEIDVLAARLEDLIDEAQRNRTPVQRAWDRMRGRSWVTSREHVVYVAYADLFSQGAPGESPLARCRARLDYLQELGVTNLHLLPLFRSSGDAGFAVEDYASVDPRFGSDAELDQLVADLHARGMALTLDFVCNHVSDSHPWARAAREGDPRYRGFFVEDPSGTGAHWPGVLDLFPEFAPGHWDWVPELETYFWATFYARQPKKEGPVRNAFSQWDLNYSNPEVLVEMGRTLLQLANRGVDCLRLDAVLFLWKQEGTGCASLPELHKILQVFRHLLDAAAPSVCLLAEANDDFPRLAPYFGEGEAEGQEMQLAYGFPLLAFLWYAAEFGDASPLTMALEKCPPIPPGCHWLLFDEVHDEVTMEIVEAVLPCGVGRRVRRRLFERFTESGRGLPFRFQPEKDPVGLGMAGTRWSLLGGEQAELRNDRPFVERVHERIGMLLGFELAMAGTPLIYSGSELGVLPDWEFRQDPEKAPDTRFVKRVPLTPEILRRRKLEGTRERRVFLRVRDLLAVRRAEPAFDGNLWELLEDGPAPLPSQHHQGDGFAPPPPPRPGLLGIRRPHESGDVLAWMNFGDEPLSLLPQQLGAPPRSTLRDLVSGESWEAGTPDSPGHPVDLPARHFRWLKVEAP